MALSRQPQSVVLLVQPDHDDRRMYIEFLRHEGLTVLSPENAADALPLAAQVDVIVTGILLPGDIDGIEFIERLRSDDRTKDKPVIVLTACAWHTELERAVNAGCDLFLPKPCLPDELLREVRRLLAMARLRDLGTRPAKAETRRTDRRRSR
jgi:CheY-like chemotaxis protein